MESPKSTANIKIGTSGVIGPVWVTPTRPFSQPNWNTPTITPNAAAAENRFMIAAVAGMTRLRNRIISKMNDRATTMTTNNESLADSWPAKSSDRAVCPPTSTSSLLPCKAAGMTVPRSWPIRAEVEASCGEPADQREQGRKHGTEHDEQ